MGTRLMYHHFQHLWVLQHGAGPQMITVERLMVVIGHEQRRLKSFQQGFFSDIGVGVVNKGTGLHIAVCVDMEIVSASCNTSAHILTVVLKIDREDRLGGAVLPHLPVHEFPLFRIWQQVSDCLIAHWHIVEEPGELGATVDQMVNEFFRADGVHIFEV